LSNFGISNFDLLIHHKNMPPTDSSMKPATKKTPRGEKNEVKNNNNNRLSANDREQSKLVSKLRQISDQQAPLDPVAYVGADEACLGWRSTHPYPCKYLDPNEDGEVKSSARSNKKKDSPRRPSYLPPPGRLPYLAKGGHDTRTILPSTREDTLKMIALVERSKKRNRRQLERIIHRESNMHLPPTAGPLRQEQFKIPPQVETEILDNKTDKTTPKVSAKVTHGVVLKSLLVKMPDLKAAIKNVQSNQKKKRKKREENNNNVIINEHHQQSLLFDNVQVYGLPLKNKHTDKVDEPVWQKELSQTPEHRGDLPPMQPREPPLISIKPTHRGDFYLDEKSVVPIKSKSTNRNTHKPRGIVPDDGCIYPVKQHVAIPNNNEKIIYPNTLDTRPKRSTKVRWVAQTGHYGWKFTPLLPTLPHANVDPANDSRTITSETLASANLIASKNFSTAVETINLLSTQVANTPDNVTMHVQITKKNPLTT